MEKLSGPFSRRTIIAILLHIAAWSVVLFFPFSFSGDAFSSGFIINASVPVLCAACIFYLNYLWLTRKYLFNRKYWQFAVINLLAIALFLALRQFVHNLTPPPPGAHHHHRPEQAFFSLFFSFRDFILFVLSMGAAVALRSTGRWSEEEARRKRVENEHLKSEISYLRHQLQPHFFFNTLNNIYALIDSTPSDAKASIIQLGKLMRYLLYKSSEDLVPMSGEISFLENYLSLMELRLGSHVTISTQFNVPRSEKVMLPPLLFLPLIENAVKHGVHGHLQSTIRVEISVFGSSLKCRVVNTYFPKNDSDQSGSGIGLQNLRKRLELLFGHEYKLDQLKEETLYVSELIIPFQYANEVSGRG